MKFVLFRAFTLLFLIPFAIVGQEDDSGNPENWCRNGHFAGYTDFRLAKVVGTKGAKAYFYSDDDDCPNASLAKCKRKAYLISGDTLVVSKTYKNFVCGWFQPVKGSETVGWLSLDSLEITKPAYNPPLNKWLGMWHVYDNSILITNDDEGKLRIEGEAFWKGVGDNIHVGEVNGSAKPQGNRLTIEEEICKVTLTLVGNYLIAKDNSDCGGMNVTFDGVYRLKK